MATFMDVHTLGGPLNLGAAAQAQHAIMDPAPRSQHQDGRSVGTGPQVSQDGEPVVIGQAQIEHHSSIAGGGENGPRVGRGRDRVRGETGGLQALSHQSRKLLVVLDQKQSHGIAADVRLRKSVARRGLEWAQPALLVSST